jgi:hypothetical protein
MKNFLLLLACRGRGVAPLEAAPGLFVAPATGRDLVAPEPPHPRPPGRGRQTFVKETLPDAESAVFPFRVGRDASFELTWQWADRVGESSWSGGMIAVGPMIQRHTMTIDADAGVLYNPTAK